MRDILSSSCILCGYICKVHCWPGTDRDDKTHHSHRKYNTSPAARSLYSCTLLQTRGPYVSQWDAAKGSYRAFHQSLGFSCCPSQKKDESICFCVDFRKVNDVTNKDAYPLPHIDTTLNTLARAQWLTTLDLLSGYWQMEIDEADRENPSAQLKVFFSSAFFSSALAVVKSHNSSVWWIWFWLVSSGSIASYKLPTLSYFDIHLAITFRIWKPSFDSSAGQASC